MGFSKGVDFYSYTAIDGVTIKFWGSGDVGRTNSKSDNFTQHHLELDSSNIGLFDIHAVFKWDVIVNNQSICSRYQEVNVYTGNLGDGDLSPLMNTDAVIINDDYIITFGLYDAGPGWSGLPSAHQAWVTVIPNLAGWMGKVAPFVSDEDDKPFSTFVLPAAHDAGMNTMNGITTVTSGAAGAIFEAALWLLLPAAAVAAATFGPNLLLDLAITQKESTLDLLEMGVRYFDFRPAYLLPGVKDLVSKYDDTLYHTHMIVPGQRFDDFLRDIVSFLKKYGDEIVVVRTCADGIKVCTPATHDEINSFAQAAVKGTTINIGDSSSFKKKIVDLRSRGTRLIIVKDNPKYDSYSDDAYATLTPDPIVKAFSGMSTGGQSGDDFTVLQCQGTSTNITKVIIADVTDANVSTSPLMATKASFDCSTLPWIRQNALNNLKAPENLIIMNDFIDGATTHTAYELSQARFSAKTSLAEVLPTKAIVPQAAAPPSYAPIVKEIPVDKSLQGAQQVKGRAEKELQEMKVKRAQLEAIVAATKVLRDEGNEVDEVTLEVQEEIKEGLEKKIEAQREAIAITEKRVEAAQAGGL